MKLRNKKTGEICEFMIHKRIEDSEDGNPVYKPFNDSVEDWEYYEEPKEYWYIDTSMMEVTYNTLGAESYVEEFNKQIGNYFETKEEAEKAVEKLKAWTRLKEKGFRFTGFDGGRTYIDFTFDKSGEPGSAYEDLDLLFGGEK